MLVFGGNPEIRENENEDENIVYAQRFLDEITGKKLQPYVRPELPDNAPVEKQGQSYPNHGPSRRLSHTDFVALAMEDEKIYRQHGQYENVEPNPHSQLAFNHTSPRLHVQFRSPE